MVYTVSITSQGQISIPAQIRRDLGLSRRSRAIVSQENGKILVKPVKDLLELGGMFKTNKKPLTNAEIDKIVAKAVADEYVKKMKRMK